MKASAQLQLTSITRADWRTPDDLFATLDAEFDFTLDPCSTDDNAKCAKHYTKADNGLGKSWVGERVFMNPPYGREIAAWCRKAHREADEGATVVGLLPSRTDTAWWHEDVQDFAEVRFLRGRVKFSGGGPAPFPSCVVVWRPRFAFQINQRDEIVDNTEHTTALMKAQQYQTMLQESTSVRRLTPVECCRLQSFPDNWLGDPNEQPDSPRYAAMGDAVTVNVAQFLGERLLASLAGDPE